MEQDCLCSPLGLNYVSQKPLREAVLVYPCADWAGQRRCGRNQPEPIRRRVAAAVEREHRCQRLKRVRKRLREAAGRPAQGHLREWCGRKGVSEPDSGRPERTRRERIAGG
ncbi:unnamed protein product [Natator depressus]